GRWSVASAARWSRGSWRGSARRAGRWASTRCPASAAWSSVLKQIGIDKERRACWNRPMSGHHLAQLNVGRLLAPIDDPLIAGFVERLDPVNAIAYEAPVLVWR